MFSNQGEAMENGREESKAERTRRKVYDTALQLFREKGFDETTMRDISREAGLSLGAAYYYFPSKETIIASFYEATQEAHHAYVLSRMPLQNTLQERLSLVFHSKIELLQNDRAMLGTIFRYTGDPKHPLSVLGEGTRELQQQAMQTIALALRGERLSDEMAELLPMALWSLQMGALLYLLYDTSENQTRTFTLIDQSLALTLQLVALARKPLFQPVVTPMLRQVTAILDTAQINLSAAPKKE